MAYQQNESSLSDRVLKRTQELARVKAGKASETPGNPEKRQRVDSEGANLGGNPQASSFGPAIIVGNPQGAVGSEDARDSRNAVRSAQGEIPGSALGELWERLSKMEADKQSFEKQQTELMSNLVLNVAKMQQQIAKTDKATTSSGNTECFDTSSETDGVSAIVDPVDSESEQDDSASSALSALNDLDGLYAETKQSGPAIDENLARLLNRAIDRNMPDEQYRELEDKYLVPENCPRLEVPVVNRELWNALKDRRESDLALQSVQRVLKHAMVPTLQALEILKNKGDESKYPQLFKDLFKILANGIYNCNKKRKSLIKPAVPSKYRKVCDIEAPVTANLFGDDIDSRVDEIEKEEKRSQKFTNHSDHFLYQKPAQKGRSTNWSGRNTEKQQKSRLPAKSRSQSSRGKPHPSYSKGKKQY